MCHQLKCGSQTNVAGMMNVYMLANQREVGEEKPAIIFVLDTIMRRRIDRVQLRNGMFCKGNNAISAACLLKKATGTSQVFQGNIVRLCWLVPEAC